MQITDIFTTLRTACETRGITPELLMVDQYGVFITLDGDTYAMSEDQVPLVAAHTGDLVGCLTELRDLNMQASDLVDEFITGNH